MYEVSFPILAYLLIVVEYWLKSFELAPLSPADNNELANDTKRKEVLRVISKKLKAQALSSDMDFSILNPDKIIDGLKYYSATGKIVGQLPKFLFKLGNKPSIKTSKFEYEASKVIPSIEIKQKK